MLAIVEDEQHVTIVQLPDYRLEHWLPRDLPHAEARGQRARDLGAIG